MFNLNKYKNTKNNKEKNEFEYVKTISFIGLGISGSYLLNDSYTEGILITPQVTVVKSTAPDIVFFDFNNKLYNINTNSKIIESFFSKFSVGNTFDVTDSVYNFDEHDLNANFTFVNFKNNLLVATCAAGLTNAAEQTYYPELFNSVPVFELSSSKVLYTDSNKLLLTNIIPSVNNSFISAGIKANDILEFFDQKYTVESIKSKINNTVEELILINFNDYTVVPSIQLNSYTIINVYKRLSTSSGTSLSLTPTVTMPTVSDTSDQMYM